MYAIPEGGLLRKGVDLMVDSEQRVRGIVYVPYLQGREITRLDIIFHKGFPWITFRVVWKQTLERR
jgi:hypothetical protein